MTLMLLATTSAAFITSHDFLGEEITVQMQIMCEDILVVGSTIAGLVSPANTAAGL